MGLTRRSLAALLAALLPGIRPAQAADPLARVFTATGSARAVGQAYLRATGAAAAPLRAQVVARLGQDPARLDTKALRRLVTAAVREDFRRGDVVSVDGWVLSALEARLCALAVPASREVG